MPKDLLDFFNGIMYNCLARNKSPSAQSGAAKQSRRPVNGTADERHGEMAEPV